MARGSVTELEPYQKAIARIYKGNAVIGAGFWVEGGYLFTCAHVVRDALGTEQAAQPVGQVIKVNFPYLDLGQKLSAEVLFYKLLKDEEQPNIDIAALRLLDQPLPSGVASVPLSLSYQLHHPYCVLGFPKGHAKGISSFGQLLLDLPQGWVQLEDTKAPGMAILPGFSGAPVWSETERAVVGMVVAREKDQPEAKIGFMIPARSLLKVHKKLESLSLFSLLQPHAAALTSSLCRAYTLAAPEGWSEGIPGTLEGMLKGLQEMPKGDEPYQAIARFTALLCSPNLNPDEDLRQQLQTWLAQRLSDPQTLLESIQSLLEPADREPETATESHLLIYVKDDVGEAKSVLALFIPSAERYDSQTGAVCDRVHAPGAEPFIDEKVTLETLPKLVRACIKEVMPKAHNLLVHLMLPLAWVNQACDRWPLMERSALSAILSQALPPELKMGAHCRLVVRISERLNAEIRDYFEEDWRKKWTALQNLQPPQVCAAFIPGDGLCLQTELVAKLKQPQTLGLKLLTVYDEPRSQQFLGALIATGTPAALWLRQNQFDESLVAADEIDTILTCRIAMLPEAIRQCRSDAMGAAEDAHIGHHLAFLWEDPNLVPPSTDPRNAMSFGMPKAS